jgi:hypothetical protein
MAAALAGLSHLRVLWVGTFGPRWDPWTGRPRPWPLDMATAAVRSAAVAALPPSMRTLQVSLTGCDERGGNGPFFAAFSHPDPTPPHPQPFATTLSGSSSL